MVKKEGVAKKEEVVVYNWRMAVVTAKEEDITLTKVL